MLRSGWFSGGSEVCFDKSLVTQDTTRIGRLHHDVPGVYLLMANAYCHGLISQPKIWPLSLIVAHVVNCGHPFQQQHFLAFMTFLGIAQYRVHGVGEWDAFA